MPRGGKNLVARVQDRPRARVRASRRRQSRLRRQSRIARHGQDHRAQRQDAPAGVCGAAETLLVDQGRRSTQLKPLVTMLLDAGCEVRGDETVRGVDARVKPVSEEDWATEYEAPIISAKIVGGLDEAIAHIERYGSHHTDAIVTEDADAANRFLNQVDSAIVLHNASTQFADGGEFGFGAEIGIATGKFHARGPVGVEQLTSFKYRVHGTGQTRP